MQGKSVSPLTRLLKPQLSVWYQMFHSNGYGVSALEMKSTASCATSTMYSLAPMLSNGGISKLGTSRLCTWSPCPECAKPTTAFCDFPHLRIGRSHDGQSSICRQ